MRVHNLMMDLVSQKVEEYFHTKDETVYPDMCWSEPCKMDVLCYVLNRVPPLYVVSGRGMAHSESKDFSERTQRMADITALIREGMGAVAGNQRLRSDEPAEKVNLGPYWNFPSIIGRLFNGLNFAPMSDISVHLLENGQNMQVIDPNWQNPYQMVKNTAGTYLFWPHPVKAQQAGERKNFHLEIRVDHPAYDPLRYGFELALISEEQFSDFASTTASHRLKDLYLFPSE